jgi:hypothetical protein
LYGHGKVNFIPVKGTKLLEELFFFKEGLCHVGGSHSGAAEEIHVF